MEVGLARCNSVSRRAFALTSPPLRGSNNLLFIWPIYFSEANTICLTFLVSSTGASSENPYQVVEHHLVEGEHVAALRDGALEKEITSSPWSKFLLTWKSPSPCGERMCACTLTAPDPEPKIVTRDGSPPNLATLT